MKKLVATGIITLVILVTCAVGWAHSFGWHRAYVNWMPWDLSKYLVENHRPASECFDLIWFEIMAPSQAEQRALCVYEYAQTSHDPTVCELLLPSEYGLACISNLWLLATPGEGCGWNVKDDTIYQCRNWATDRFIQSRDCKAFEKYTKQFSTCIESFAERNHHLAQCKEIPDEFIRIFCETEVSAWLKYPQLRNSFYFGTLLPLYKAKN